MPFHKRLRYLRQSKKISQQQLADKIGVNRGTIDDYEFGGCYPSFKVFIKLVEVLEIDPKHLSDDYYLQMYNLQDNILEWKFKNKFTYRQISAIYGFNEKSLYEWIKGKYPNRVTFDKYQKFFKAILAQDE